MPNHTKSGSKLVSQTGPGATRIIPLKRADITLLDESPEGICLNDSRTLAESEDRDFLGEVIQNWVIPALVNQFLAECAIRLGEATLKLVRERTSKSGIRE